MNIENLYSNRFATFHDIGTMVIPAEDVKYITAMGNSNDVVILVFRAFGNYKAWLKDNGINDKLACFKSFYKQVLECDWKTETDKNIATAKNLLEYHRNYPIYYTKMTNV